MFRSDFHSVAFRQLKRVEMLGLAVQPPARARPGVALYPPVAARLSSDNSIFEELSRKWAVATLINNSGEVLHDQLGGRLADSAHPLPETAQGSGSTSRAISERDRAYFYFPDLTIHTPGRYRIRISLMEMDYSCESVPEGIVRVCETIDTHSIKVEDRAPRRSSPIGNEKAFLLILREDGQDVPLLNPQ